MKRSTVFLFIVLALIAAVVAAANRQDVTFRLNPFDAGPSAWAVTMPLFLLVFLVFLAGAMVGGTTVAVRGWLSRRRVVRQAEKTVIRVPVPLDANKPSGDPSRP